MKPTLSEHIVAYLALISGLCISAVAVFYSVAGLATIFAANVIPIIIMGVTLEVSKLIATVWLKVNWKRAPALIKLYLITAIVTLMLITSMGIFGYLSKAHSDQSIISGDVTSRISSLDQQIQVQEENIVTARTTLAQLDNTVEQIIGRSTSEAGANRASRLRRSQAAERKTAQTDITAAQEIISALRKERDPITAQLRQVEAEVGAIKYIAALIYGDNPESNLLEKAVTWVIIIIVSVFDPLAVVLLLASQYSFQWFRQDRQTALATAELAKILTVLPDPVIPDINLVMPIARPKISRPKKLPKIDKAVTPVDSKSIVRIVKKSKPIAAPPTVTLPSKPAPLVVKKPKSRTPKPLSKKSTSDQQMAEVADIQSAAMPIIEVSASLDNLVVTDLKVDIESTTSLTSDVDEDNKLHPTDDFYKKLAKSKWKRDNPESNLKHQRELLQKGIIRSLPWESADILADVEREDAVREANKWANEQKASSLKKVTKPT